MSVYVVTGATGYIGSMLINRVLRLEKDAEIIALVRDLEKAENMFGERVKPIKVNLADRASMNDRIIKCDYIFHCASVTKSSEMISQPVEVIESIVNTTQNVMELARKSGVKSMVYLSSMEVYGEIDCSDGHRVSENELGNVDIFNVRNCYPLGKRMAENICYSYFKEYGIPIKIARLSQTFGKGVLPTDNRVFVQFARAAKNNTDIVLRTQGTSMGNYCAIDDAVEGIFTILHKGAAGEAYNVVNEANTMQIREMAELVAQKLTGGKISIVYQIPEDNIYGYGAQTGLKLSGQKLAKLGWKSEKSLEAMYRDLLEII